MSEDLTYIMLSWPHAGRDIRHAATLAIRTIARGAQPTGIDQLARIASDSSDPEARYVAIDGLWAAAVAGSGPCVRVLASLLFDADPLVAAAVKWALDDLPGVDPAGM